MSGDDFSWNKIHPLSSLQWNSLQFPSLYKLSYYLPKALSSFYCEVFVFNIFITNLEERYNKLSYKIPSYMNYNINTLLVK